jgi:hypothetical protein
LVGHALKLLSGLLLSGLLRRNMIPKHLRQSVQQPQQPLLTDNLKNALVGCVIEATERWRCIGCCVRRTPLSSMRRFMRPERVIGRYQTGRRCRARWGYHLVLLVA